MIRPWMGAALSVLAVGVLPATAAAQAPADTTPPVIAIAGIDEGAAYTVGQPLSVSYSCVDPESTVTDCVGSVASGSPIDTSTPGSYVFTVLSHNDAGRASSASRFYTVTPAPAVLTLSLGAPPAFAPFVPGVGTDYMASTTAVINSDTGDAILTVADPSTTAAGHLLNGDTPLASALQVKGESAHGTSSGFQTVTDTADPATLETYDGPLTDEQVTLTFKQPVAQTDELRTGSYAKTIVFTVSSDRP